jgi:hypothetical protein
LPASLTGRAALAGTFGLVTGVGAGLATALLAALAGGALGPGYLAAVGPSAWQVALALAVEVGVPAALTAAILPGRGGATAARDPIPAPAGETGPGAEPEPDSG